MTMTPLPMLERIFVVFNICCYFLIIAVASCSYFLHMYNMFRVYMICTVGLLSLFVSFSLFYYGFIVWSELSDGARKHPLSKRLTNRVLVLTIVCPATLLLQGAAYILWAVMAGNHINSIPLWENVGVSLLAEWLSSIIVLVMLQAFQQPSATLGQGAASEPLCDSSDSEAPLLSQQITPPISLNSPQGGTWKQIYPQPAP